jgi:cyanophycinase-like exopeptidase
MIQTLRMLVKDHQTVLGIEGNTALVGENDDWQVVGSGGVVVWNKKEKKRYTRGERVRW